MRKLLAMAAFLLASTAAQAQYTFDYGGRTIRIDPDRGTVSIPGVYDNTGQGKTKKAKKNDAKPEQAPQQAKVDPQAPAAPAAAPAAAPPAAEQAPAAAPAAAAPPPAPPAPASTATANNAPADTAVLPPPAPPPAPTVAAAPPAPPPLPAPVQSAAVSPAPLAAPARDLNSPLGVWLTEEKEGKVRIEQCGNNLCGYSVDSKSNQSGEQVLINMKPTKDQKWSGRILDPNNGSTYDSTIALKGTDRLRVQGCAFGGMFCGGQTWTRVN
ncbi:DUF2147 domain-containing protein [Bradyrhizobium sp. RDM4]|uniref:DUF2147 domain-containing protein n=1 Tax=Bradyrhizobium sp. RDM4 TaxID=3378765 RepID=UPI0038FC57DF